MDTGDVASGIQENNDFWGAVPWQNPENIAGLEGIYTVIELGQSELSHNLIARGFNFSIPAGATIDGIEVKWRRKEDTGNVVSQTPLLWMNGSAWPSTLGTGPNDYPGGGMPLSWTGSPDEEVFGSPTDLWGANLSPAIVNSPNFGVALRCGEASSMVGAGGSVDFVTMRVYYTEGEESGSRTRSLMGVGL